MHIAMTADEYKAWVDSGEYLSGPIVMRSAAGWYVGEACMDDEIPNFPMPYDRYTGYFQTQASAEKALAVFKHSME